MEKRLLAELFRPEKKSVVVIGGANGSGKSTLVQGLELKYAFAHLDPDKIAAAVDSSATAVSAGRRIIRLRNKLFAEDSTFGIETTLSGRALNKFLRAGKAADYRTIIVYTWLDNPQLCIGRIAVRVAGGGHHVPDADVIRRFYRSNINFWDEYRLIADQWYLFYNGHTAAKLVASGKNDAYDIHNGQLFERYRGLINECENELNRKRTE